MAKGYSAANNLIPVWWFLEEKNQDLDLTVVLFTWNLVIRKQIYDCIEVSIKLELIWFHSNDILDFFEAFIRSFAPS